MVLNMSLLVQCWLHHLVLSNLLQSQWLRGDVLYSSCNACPVEGREKRQKDKSVIYVVCHGETTAAVSSFQRRRRHLVN